MKDKRRNLNLPLCRACDSEIRGRRRRFCNRACRLAFYDDCRLLASDLRCAQRAR